MNQVIERKAEEIKRLISKEEQDELRMLTRPMRLSDLMREGASVSDQAYSWTGENDSMCALSGMVASAKARGYCK